MSENYVVNYSINVQSESALAALKAFQSATKSLKTAESDLQKFQQTIDGVIVKFNELSKTPAKLNIDTQSAKDKLNHIISQLKEINRLAGKPTTVRLNESKAGKQSSKSGSNTIIQNGKSGGSGKGGGGGKSVSKPTQRVPNTWGGPIPTKNNIGYKTFSATPLPSNGGIALDMLKGMGIAYGIAGIGSGISEIVNQASTYDNLMKTVENILKSHDEKGNFSNRFQSMSRTVRNVGMETKFKVTEVADAAKFLAMAGLDLESIQQSIRPIADIALVGDTDLGETADLVTNIMTAYNISSKNMRNAADVMTNTFTMSNTTLTEIAESYKYAASLLSAGGISFEESTAAIGVLGDAGVKGSQAGTTLRTILANIVNPTQKQKAAWDRIGISNKDKDGNMKSMLDIFKELNEKNLNVEDYYKIFHKTAVSGAVALADHVDKWQNIYLENFLSRGLSANLADEKKNTLQGLWAQLTSVFTDQGVTAFEGVQGQLRSLMIEAIELLKSDKTKEAFREISSTIMEFVHTIIDATQWFVSLFKIFEPFIKTWVKFQLVIWPVVKGLQAFKSLLLGTQWLASVSNRFKSVATNIKGIATATNEANAAAQVANGQQISGVVGGKGNIKDLAVYNRYMRYQRYLMTPSVMWGNTKTWLKDAWANKNRFAAHALVYSGNAARMGAGALASYAGMSQLTKENANGWDHTSGAMLGLAGMSAMAGGPVGWAIGGALAFGALVANIGSAITRLGELKGYVDQFTSTHQMLDGVITNSSSKTERALEFVWRKHYSVNELLERRIELSKILHGIESSESASSKDIGADLFNSLLDKFNHADSWIDSRPAATQAVRLFNAQAEQLGLQFKLKDAMWGLVDNKTGQFFRVNNPNGTSDDNDVAMYEVAAAMEMLNGPYRNKIVEETQKTLAKALYGKSSSADIERLKQDFILKYNPANMSGLIRPDERNASAEEARAWGGEEISRSYVGNMLVWRSLSNQLQAYDALIKFKEKVSKNQHTSADIVDALRIGDNNILGSLLADYNPNNILSWFSNQGFVNGSWVSMRGQTPEVMAEMAAGNMKYLIESIQKLGLAADPAAKDIMMYAQTLLNLSNAYLNNNGKPIAGSKDGEVREIGGQRWRWNAMSNSWVLVDSNGQYTQMAGEILNVANSLSILGQVAGLFHHTPTASSPNTIYQGDLINGDGTPVPWWPKGGFWAVDKTNKTVSLTPQQFGNLVGGKDNKQMTTMQNNTGANVTNTVNNTSGGTTGVNIGDYKNHYSNGNAAPKQVIVRIGNLMNVDKIDLSNKDNAAVIANIKNELAQALIDVVHDFDETWHS